MVIGQAERDGLPEHRTHGAVPALLQVSEEDGFFCLPVLEEIPGGVRSDHSAATYNTSNYRLAYSFRYLQIMPATFSQFLLVGQNTRHECVGMTSVTRAMMWSGSIFCIELEY